MVETASHMPPPNAGFQSSWLSVESDQFFCHRHDQLHAVVNGHSLELRIIHLSTVIGLIRNGSGRSGTECCSDMRSGQWSAFHLCTASLEILHDPCFFRLIRNKLVSTDDTAYMNTYLWDHLAAAHICHVDHVAVAFEHGSSICGI